MDTTPPLNDNYGNSIFIGGPTGRSFGNNCNATAETGEPAFGAAAGNTVWWSWTAPSGGGNYLFNTRGSTYNTVLCLFTGASLDTRTPVACNDDFPGLGALSQVQFTGTPGTNYLIRVDSHGSSDAGDITLNWGPADAPLLYIERIGGAVRVFWPKPSAGFVLDQSLTLTGAWSQVSFPYTTNTTDISITVPTPTGNRFYRLRSP